MWLTKQTKVEIVVVLILAIVGLSMICYQQEKTIDAYDEMLHKQMQFTDSIIDAMYTTDEQWSDMIKAIAWQESKWDDKAVGAKDDVGYLQITPIYVAEANRIAGFEKFKLDDRYDRQKSIDIFNTIQSYYNPQRNLHLACKIHNNNAPLYYHRVIENKYNELQSSKQIE